MAMSCQSGNDAAHSWRPLYENARWDTGAEAWLDKGTNSRRTADGLLVAATSPQGEHGRFYILDWKADPRKGAAVEARVKVATCSDPRGVAILVADGVHEETLTLYPHRLALENAKQSVDFDASDGFHTYRLEIRGTDVRLFADGKMLIDGAGKFTAPALGKPPRNQCGFGCGPSPAAAEATWQWVRYRSDLPARRTLEMPPNTGLKVTVGETVLISPDGDYHPNIYFRKLGNLPNGARAIGFCAYEFPDGEIISPGYNSDKVRDGVFEVRLARSTDGGKTFKDERARLNIPDGTGGSGDDGNYYEPCVDHAIVRLRDGSLLMSMYGYFKTDTVLAPNFDPKWRFHKYRTWVMRSTDRGRTWDYRATVAYDPAVGFESFCEPDLLVLPNGDILSFMRTGGCHGGAKYAAPLYMNVSKDDGKTWSKPVPIADRGVWPNACRMRNGVLAVTYGRPDNWLAFSHDDGKTWVGHFCFYRDTGTTSYNSVEEIAPGRLMVVYDHPGLDAGGNLTRWVVGTFVDVKVE
jgi:hypothetical protein